MDDVFKLPKFVMTREGQDRFEGIARKDSEYSVSSEFSVFEERPQNNQDSGIPAVDSSSGTEDVDTPRKNDEVDLELGLDEEERRLQ